MSSVKEILLIGFYQQSKEMARFILDMQKKHNLSIRLLNSPNPCIITLKYPCCMLQVFAGVLPPWNWRGDLSFPRSDIKGQPQSVLCTSFRHLLHFPNRWDGGVSECQARICGAGVRGQLELCISMWCSTSVLMNYNWIEPLTNIFSRHMHPFCGSQANESQSLNYGCIAEDPKTHKVNEL